MTVIPEVGLGGTADCRLPGGVAWRRRSAWSLLLTREPAAPEIHLPRGARSIILTGMTDVTQILSAIEQGDPHAADQLLPLVYEELRQLAAQKLAQEKPGQTLQATALVHEAYLRLVDAETAAN